MRRFRVVFCFAEVTQQIHSFRASGVISVQRLLAAALDSMALRKSAGNLWTVPSASFRVVIHHACLFRQRQSSAADAQRVHRCVHGPKPDRVGRVELVQLNALPVGSPHHREGGPHIFEPDQSPDQRPFDCRFALKLESQFDEERLGGFEIVHNDEDVVLLMPALGACGV